MSTMKNAMLVLWGWKGHDAWVRPWIIHIFIRPLDFFKNLIYKEPISFKYLGAL
jgi:hypothetical protein